MSAFSTIPGVTLEVYKQNRQLTPESDGYVGQLFSGSATILAVIDPSADKMIGLFRDGQDHYVRVWNWLTDVSQIPSPIVQEQQRKRQKFLEGHSFQEGSQVYGVNMPLRVFSYESPPINTVHYPENMLILARYVRGKGGCLTGGVQIWKVALVSQNGEFFLTVQQAYNTTAYRNADGQMRFPRFEQHRLLERVLVANAPEDLPLMSEEKFVFVKQRSGRGLQEGEGIVDRWYAARNMGCVITAKGSARVHWSDVPPRPRLRFLVEGERVRIGTLGAPPQNPKTDLRKVRKSRFELQATGIEVG